MNEYRLEANADATSDRSVALVAGASAVFALAGAYWLLREHRYIPTWLGGYDDEHYPFPGWFAVYSDKYGVESYVGRDFYSKENAELRSETANKRATYLARERAFFGKLRRDIMWLETPINKEVNERRRRIAEDLGEEAAKRAKDAAS